MQMRGVVKLPNNALMWFKRFKRSSGDIIVMYCTQCMCIPSMFDTNVAKYGCVSMN